MIFKKFLEGLLNKPAESKKDMTEEEILSAIDRLPNKQAATAPTPTVNDPTVTTTAVREPGLYSLFRYIKQTDIYGLPENGKEGAVSFLIPCGMEWDSSLKVWFVTFPLNGTVDDVVDFYTVINPLEG